MLGDCRYDVANGGLDFLDDPVGAWLQELFGDYREIAYEGYSHA